MGKKILAIYYSQSGQLAEIIDQFTAPLTGPGITVEKVRIQMAADYPFPWTSEQFYSVMPDCVLGVSGKLASFTLKENSYDLIILGYQAWFLYPSIPVNSLLHDPAFRAILPNTPVITITGARNMWLNAFTGVRQLLNEAGARLVGNIALVDRHPNHISYITIFHWLLGGKKDRYLGFFPCPGVSADDIAHTAVFGQTVLGHLDTGSWKDLQSELLQQKAVRIKYGLMLLENKALPTYTVWARFILKRKKRNGWLVVFKYYLVFSLFVAAPVLLVLNGIFVRPFRAKWIKAKKQHYSVLN
jgi:hypothetical protein